MSEIVERNIGQSRFFDQFLIMNVIPESVNFV